MPGKSSSNEETPVGRLNRQLAALERRDAQDTLARNARQEWEEQHPGQGELDS